MQVIGVGVPVLGTTVFVGVVTVAVGVTVITGVSVGVGVGTTVSVGVDVGTTVSVAVAVAVTVGIGVLVLVAVGVAVTVGVAVGVTVEVGIGLPPPPAPARIRSMFAKSNGPPPALIVSALVPETNSLKATGIAIVRGAKVWLSA